MPVKAASTRTVASLVDHWKNTAPEVLRCRAWYHSWDDYDVLETPRRFVVIMACNRCGALRHRSLNAKTGKPLTGWTANLPDGYAVPAGSGRITNATNQIVFLAASRSMLRRQVAEDDVPNELRAARKAATAIE